MGTAATDDAGSATRALIFALVALACGHMLSTLLRTIPAISLDLMAADFHIEPQALASLTSVYHFAFAAAQIPVGAAMDRFGVRPVSLALLAGTVFGAVASGFATGPESFAVGQLMLGVATSGMLMCPMTLAAKQLSAARFGLWSGAILSIGNIGMLLSSSPLAFVVDTWGWRAGFWISAAGGVVVALAVFALVPNQPAEHKDHSSPMAQMIEVLRLGLSRPLRGLIALALVSLASSLVLRGLWGGPWLMEIKGLTRVEAGNQLGAFTLAMIVGPLLIGMIDRRIGRRRQRGCREHSTDRRRHIERAGGGSLRRTDCALDDGGHGSVVAPRAGLVLSGRAFRRPSPAIAGDRCRRSDPQLHELLRFAGRRC
ncbi:MFS family permease [Bradyrhizobium diazoefficiens]|uniref:Major facilitator superfamily (MFS) profile domain-containing protein n=1 Tax=Bradyrhizobium diazoefficiens TaxID=1355477 RepID=A0A0E4G079_9BRAD|nr:hypothetical protein NK6_6671 [Bradyrhizobium diazoefficiens]